MNASHQLAITKYETFREAALTVAQRSIESLHQDSFVLKSIDHHALTQSFAWEATRKARGETLPWSFFSGFSSYKFRHPNRFDLAVWSDSTLCSLAIGIPTKTATSMRLDVIEASPEITPLSGSVLKVNLVAFEAYAQAIGARSITIMRPLNEKLVNFYRTHGFIFQKSRGSAPARMWRPL